MDSYVLAETFKYLYLLFAEKEDLLFDVDEFLFTTEAHLLPLSLSIVNKTTPGTSPIKVGISPTVIFNLPVFPHSQSSREFRKVF